MNYDPDKALWLPGRRRFLFLSGLTLAGTVLGVKAATTVTTKSYAPVGGFYQLSSISIGDHLRRFDPPLRLDSNNVLEWGFGSDGRIFTRVRTRVSG